MGDDINDIPPMSLCGFVGCPKDSCTEVLERADYVSRFEGGHGAMRDVVEHIFRERGEWDALNKLGDMYKDGIYVPKDERMAFSIYNHCFDIVKRDDSNDAYPGVLRRLGECLYKGIGVEADVTVAKNLLKESIEIYERQIDEGNYYAKLSVKRAKELLAEIVEKEEI